MTSALQVEKYLNTKSLWGQVQLQKLLYYSQAWSLAWTGRPLFADTIEAWQGGPVVPAVYYGGTSWMTAPQLNADARAIVDAVYEFYGAMGGARLSARTHSEQPWIDARGDAGPRDRTNTPILQDAMRRYYARQVIEGREAPKAPTSVHHVARSEDARAAVASQRARWRQTLDALAHR